MKKTISMLLLCVSSTFAMAQDFIIVAQPVVCMIQSDAICGIAGSPVSVIHNDDDIIIKGGSFFPLAEKDDATDVENITEKDNNIVKPQVESFYSFDGRLLSAPQKGMNILKMSDGTTRKVAVQ